MSLTQHFLLLFGLSALIVNHAQARSARRLKGESIIGGEDAAEGQIPYHISLRNSQETLCGGSILDERFVITAAHCVVDGSDNFYSEPLQVVAGINDLNSKSSKYRVVVDVAKVFVPKEYEPVASLIQRSIGDIAVLKLKENLGIEKNPNLSKIKLPEKGNTYAGVEATVSGFGWNEINVTVVPFFEIVESGGKSYGKLRYAKANVLEHTACEKAYSVGLDADVKPKHICARVEQRDPKKSESICTGDSGGPLVYENVLIGVINTSPRGCRENVKPGVYTRVTEYLDFISKVVSGNIDKNIRSTTLTFVSKLK